MRGRSPATSGGGAAVDPFGRGVQVEEWVAEQLAAAPPLTSEQLCRLQLLLATDRLLARKSA